MLLLLSLACTPASDVEERLAALEAENHSLQTRVEKLEANERELMQQLARWEQSLSVLEGAATGVLEPADLNTPARSRASAEGAACQVDDSGAMQVDLSLLSDETLSRSMRAIPHKDASGNLDGFRLSAIRRGSLLDSCGFKNGDIIHSINGQSLTSVESAMSAYQSLKADTTFTFSITRRGKPSTVSLSVR